MYNQIIQLLTTTLSENTKTPLAVYEISTGSGTSDTFMVFSAMEINGVVGYPCSRVSEAPAGYTRFDSSWLVTALDVKAGSVGLISALQALTWA